VNFIYRITFVVAENLLLACHIALAPTGNW